MPSASLNSTRDSLYDQWKKDVEEMRKAKKEEIALKHAGELENIEVTHDSALKQLKEQGKTATDVAKLKTIADKEIKAMEIEASGKELADKISNQVAIRGMEDTGAMQRTVAEQAGAMDRTKLMNPAPQPGYNPDEMQTMLSNATSTVDKEGNITYRDPSVGELATLNTAARQSGATLKSGGNLYKSLPIGGTAKMLIQGASKVAGFLTGDETLKNFDPSRYDVKPDPSAYYFDYDPNATATRKLRKIGTK